MRKKILEWAKQKIIKAIVTDEELREQVFNEVYHDKIMLLATSDSGTLFRETLANMERLTFMERKSYKLNPYCYIVNINLPRPKPEPTPNNYALAS